MTNLIPLPDGRVLAVDDRGPSSAPAVVFLHAAPGSRVLDPDPDATAQAGVRLLTIDRPGYGQSSPPPDGTVPTLAGIADDVAHSLKSLGIGPASVVGWSAGGRVALTLAARHPSLVASVGVVGTPAPDEAVPWVPEEFRQMTPAVRADPVGALPMLAGAFAQYGVSPEAAIESVTGGPADEAVLGDPARRAQIVAMLAEAFRPGPTGAAADVIAVNVVPDEGQLRRMAASVQAPVALFCGDADVVAGPEHGRWWEMVLSRATLNVVPDAGHLVVLTAWAQILSAVTEDRSR
jgi:pimeloyl-ACP methyl ester carboxylesterase